MYVHMLMFYMYNGSKFRYINLMDNTRATKYVVLHVRIYVLNSSIARLRTDIQSLSLK